MFGLKIFNKTKSKKFNNDNDRKRYFAIQRYYKQKDNNASKPNYTKKKTTKK